LPQSLIAATNHEPFLCTFKPAARSATDIGRSAALQKDEVLDSFVALKFLSYLLLPPAATLVGVLLGAAALLLGYRRTGTAIAALSVLEGIVLSLPPVADALVAPLERAARVAAAESKPCCYAAIVVLGGGIVPAIPPALSEPHLVEGADRIWLAARLYHAGLAPRIIASGGQPRASGASQSEAQAMQQILVALGVPATAIDLEDRSQNTIENIAFVRQLTNGGGVALVTSAYHMPRALRIAAVRGLKASAFPTDWQTIWNQRASWQNWLPTLDAARLSERAIREHIAALFDWRERRY